MTSWPLGIAVRLVAFWARLYTLGLPPAHRRDRIDLILGDVHDEIAGRLDGGDGVVAVAVSLVDRCVRGVPADLSWRVFDAPRAAGFAPVYEERAPVMTSRATTTRFLFIASEVAWITVVVLAIEAPAHSLAWAGALLGAVALTAWALDSLGRPSPWPFMLAAGITAIAAGIAFDGSLPGLLLAILLAAGLTVAFVRGWLACRSDRRPESAHRAPDDDVAAHVQRGDVIAIEQVPHRGVTRRALLRGGFGIGLTSVLAAMGGVVVDFLYQRNVAGFGGVVTAGKVEDFPPGSKTIVRQGKFWLVNLTAEQGGPGFLALWQKCPHLGCVVPWNAGFRFVDPRSGDATEGWFRCPCHQSTYDHAGVRVFGPAPRSMDRMALTITEDGYIEVDTGDISKGTDDNATHAAR